MNYKSYAYYDNKPPYYNKKHEAYYDTGSGIPQLTKNNMTIQDLFRTPFLLIDDHPNTDFRNMAEEALKGIQTQSDLSKLFFSDRNIKRIQRKIKSAVFRRTKGKYRLDTDQDPSDVFIIMRAIYMEHSRFLPGETVRQVKRLNDKVINDHVADIISNIKQYYGYLEEINKPLTPIPRPINVSNAGRLALPSITTTWGVEDVNIVDKLPLLPPHYNTVNVVNNPRRLSSPQYYSGANVNNSNRSPLPSQQYKRE
uniref:Minor capsid protein P8 central region domain-containing protein n=1 Tax=Mimivirus LCMiAC02 TaxID=2506609 RepID=A0A481Z0B6_9VIRU|nr:MAG: uncharacterized protein LCMiAC02_00460 [Mimivirus LCMiAC02]